MSGRRRGPGGRKSAREAVSRLIRGEETARTNTRSQMSRIMLLLISPPPRGGAALLIGLPPSYSGHRFPADMGSDIVRVPPIFGLEEPCDGDSHAVEGPGAEGVR